MADPLLRVENLVKRFGGIVASDDVSLDVGRGELHAIIGPNGAGKTTLISQLTGQFAPNAGTIHFAGHDITALPAYRRSALGLARSFQITSLLPRLHRARQCRARGPGACRPLLPFLAQRRARKASSATAARAALARVGLEPRADVVVAALSHGEQRQLELAMALATKPQMLLLDEPMAGIGRDEIGADGRPAARAEGAKSPSCWSSTTWMRCSRSPTASPCWSMAASSPPARPTAIRADAEVRRAYLGERMR